MNPIELENSFQVSNLILETGTVYKHITALTAIKLAIETFLVNWPLYWSLETRTAQYMMKFKDEQLRILCRGVMPHLEALQYPLCLDSGQCQLMPFMWESILLWHIYETAGAKNSSISGK